MNPTPTNKEELLQRLETSREAFLDLIENMDEDQLTRPLTPADPESWSVRDILAHLSRWEAELIKLLWQAGEGQKPTTAQFTPNNKISALNQAWRAEGAGRQLERVLEDFHAVRNQTLLRVETFDNKDLFDPKRFGWLGGRALYAWIAESTYEHEAEHMAQLAGPAGSGA